MIDKGKHNVLGVLVNAVDYETAVAGIVTAANARQGFAVSALAVHGVMTGYLDSQQKHRLNCFDLILPDGQPVRWALKWLHGIDLRDRVYGPRLMLQCCAEAARRSLPVFLYGSTDEVIANLSSNLQRQFPTLRIAGKQSSKFRRLSVAEKQQVVHKIHESGARIVFVGLGCPRQEVWAYEFRSELSLPIVAVGGAFSVHAGAALQAPGWMQRRGLEWLFRLASEPARLWRRYLFLSPLFLVCVWSQMFGARFNTSGREPPQEVLYG